MRLWPFRRNINTYYLCADVCVCVEMNWYFVDVEYTSGLIIRSQEGRIKTPYFKDTSTKSCELLLDYLKKWMFIAVKKKHKHVPVYVFNVIATCEDSKANGGETSRFVCTQSVYVISSYPFLVDANESPAYLLTLTSLEVSLVFH